MERHEALRLLRAGHRGIKEWNRRRKAGEYVPDLRGSILRHRVLSGANFWNLELTGSDLRGSDLRRVEAFHAFIIDANLRKADLRKGRFGGADFRGANLVGADLRGADVRGADLRESDFSGADLRGTLLGGAQLGRTKLRGANLAGANLEEASLVGTDLTRADLSNSRVYGISAWDLILSDTIQSDLIITHEKDSIITVDSLEVAQFIHLLLHNEKIRHVIDTITSKVVLILGRFTPTRKPVLDKIRIELRKRGFCPVMFDFARPRSRNFAETVSTLAHMAKFVIADFSHARIVLDEVRHIVPHLAIPLVPLLRVDEKREPITLPDLRLGRTTVLATVRYRTIRDVIRALDDRIIRPALELAQRLERSR